MGEQSKSAGEMLLLDGGNSFYAALRSPPLLAWQYDRKAEMVARTYARIGMAALVPGPKDFAGGVKQLEALSKMAGAPLVASNLEGALQRERHVLLERGGIKIGILGLLSASLLKDVLGETAQFEDPVQAAVRESAALRKAGAEIVLLVAHMPDEELRPVAGVRDVDVILQGHGGTLTLVPKELTGTLMLSGGKKGKYISALTLELRHAKPGFQGAPERLKRDRRIRRLERELAGDAPMLPSERGENEKELAALQAQVAADAGRNRIDYKLVPLSPSDGTDGDVEQWRLDYNRAVADFEIARAADPKAAESLPAAGDRIFGVRTSEPEGNSFVGSAACIACHAKQGEVWKRMRHSHAYDTLVKAGQQYDPECVSCHATGFMQPGGFVLPGQVGERKNVGCEACHGMGQRHIDMRTGEHIERGMSESHCRSCHDKDNSPQFVYEIYRERIRHW